MWAATLRIELQGPIQSPLRIHKGHHWEHMGSLHTAEVSGDDCGGFRTHENIFFLILGNGWAIIWLPKKNFFLKCLAHYIIKTGVKHNPSREW